MADTPPTKPRTVGGRSAATTTFVKTYDGGSSTSTYTTVAVKGANASGR